MNMDGKVIGQSCYFDLRLADRGVEIGGTCYSPEYQGTKTNPASKLLLLDHAFASGMVRVQFKTDVINVPSRAAIAKLGAQFEGVSRKHKLRPDGTWRDTAYYSITSDEWPALKAKLCDRLNA